MVRAYNSLTIKRQWQNDRQRWRVDDYNKIPIFCSFGLYSGGKIRILSGKSDSSGRKDGENPSLGIYAADSLIVAAGHWSLKVILPEWIKKYSRIDLTAQCQRFPCYDGGYALWRFNQAVVIVWDLLFRKNDTIKYVEITQGYPIYIGNAHWSFFSRFRYHMLYIFRGWS